MAGNSASLFAASARSTLGGDGTAAAAGVGLSGVTDGAASGALVARLEGVLLLTGVGLSFFPHPAQKMAVPNTSTKDKLLGFIDWNQSRRRNFRNAFISDGVKWNMREDGPCRSQGIVTKIGDI